MGTILAEAYWGLRARISNNYKLRERLIILALFLLAYYVGMRTVYQYKMFLMGIAVAFFGIFIIHRVDLVYFFTLFYSSIHIFLRDVLLKGVPGVALLKEVMMLAVIVVVIFQLLVKQRTYQPMEIHKSLVVLLVVFTAQCFNPSVYGFMSVIDDYRLWAIALGSCFVANQVITSEKKLNFFINIVMFYALLEGIYGVVQHFLPVEYLALMGGQVGNYFLVMGDRIRSFSTMDTVHFAAFCFMLVPIALWKINVSDDFLKKVWYAGVVIILATGGAFTLVRGAWVSFILALVFSAFLFRKPMYVLVILLALIIAMTAASGVFQKRIESLLSWEDDVSIQTRLYTWSRLKSAVVFRVFGYGMGTFTHSRFTLAHGHKIIFGRATENFYLTILLETGWIGFAVYLYLMFLIYRKAYYNFRRLNNPRFRQLSAAIGTLMLVIDIGKFAGPSGYYVPESWHYWFFVGSLFAMERLDQESEEALAENLTGRNKPEPLTRNSPRGPLQQAFGEKYGLSKHTG
ncbi:O-antigen ligase family protein [Acidobacteriota bacterium]